MQLKNNLDKFKKISSLGQDELGFYLIKEDGKYLIEDGIKAKVEENTNVTILDLNANSNIYIKSDVNSNILYLAINNEKSNKTFDVSGNINYHLISLNKTEENFRINLKKEEANADVKVLCLGKAFESKFVQYISHDAKSTLSNIYNVGIALDSANVSFDTTGKIEKGMAKSNCRQLSRGIIIDDNSKVTSKPILLIDEYDCFANHGAAIGKISDEDLFYLMSRGLTKNDAFFLILKGIVAPFLDKVNEVFESEEIKEEINSDISKLIESD